MLRIISNTHAAGAKSYYSTADYYSEGQELTGRWRGKAASRLGLEGDVQKADWDALCDNLHPQTGERLTGRTNSERTVGYDFNFHVPKSVSLLYATTRDERLLDAFREAVDGTMHDIEAEMATRVRKGGKNENRQTGNMAWGEFIHFTSRPVDGVPDPHLHAHCFVHNLTFDEKEQQFKAGQFRELKRDAPYFEAVFHSQLAGRLHELGLPIERNAKGWELAGIEKSLIDKFSRRTAQIEEKARENGIENVEAKAELGAKTREQKQGNLSMSDLQTHWLGRMTPDEIHALAALERRIGGDADPKDENASARAVEYATAHMFERQSVVPERRFLATAIRHAVGQASAEEVERQAAAANLILGERNGRRMVTTPDVLDEERQVIDLAREGRGTCTPFVNHYDEFQREWLNDSQKNAVRHIVESRDQIILLRGAAGVGKTTLMQEAVGAIESSGTHVFAFAPSADASRGTLRDAGFEDADTVARLLVDKKLQEQVKGQVIWVDEAGLLGMRQMHDVFALADRADARVLLSGDRFQHGSVERGAALRLLETEAGLMPAEVKEIQRQSGAYKAAVKMLADGHAAEGFQQLDELGWVHEIPHNERYERLARDYVEAIGDRKTALVVSPTHAEADRITGEIRQRLRDAGNLEGEERTFRVLENAGLTEAQRQDAVNIASSDVLVFHQNAKGFKRGERVRAGDLHSLPLDQGKHFQVFHTNHVEFAAGDMVRITHNGFTADGKHRLDNGSLQRIRRFDESGNIVFENGWLVGKDFGHLAHGYVVTSHASQGKTVQHVFVGQSSESFPASSREQFYVSASRAKERVTIYTDDKEALREAISHSDERLSALEMVSSGPRPPHLRQTPQHWPDERARQDREEVVYDR